MLSSYDVVEGKTNSSDIFGCIAFNHEFINSDHLDTTDSIIVKMDDV